MAQDVKQLGVTFIDERALCPVDHSITVIDDPQLLEFFGASNNNKSKSNQPKSKQAKPTKSVGRPQQQPLNPWIVQTSQIDQTRRMDKVDQKQNEPMHKVDQTSRSNVNQKQGDNMQSVDLEVDLSEVRKQTNQNRPLNRNPIVETSVSWFRPSPIWFDMLSTTTSILPLLQLARHTSDPVIVRSSTSSSSSLEQQDQDQEYEPIERHNEPQSNGQVERQNEQQEEQETRQSNEQEDQMWRYSHYHMS